MQLYTSSVFHTLIVEMCTRTKERREIKENPHVLGERKRIYCQKVNVASNRVLPKMGNFACTKNGANI